MFADQVRNGLVETSHDGALAVVDAAGNTIAETGDIDRPFFIRSSAKPFQAFVSLEFGADLSPLQLGVACASHHGFPAHIAIVRTILEEAGLDESALQPPPDFPLGRDARTALHAQGQTSRKSIWHNCSGKHAAFLAACVSAGLPIATYLDPEHPLQVRAAEFVEELGGYPVGPLGVDGCGAPVFRTTVRVLATMFQRLATESRFGRIRAAMHAYPALVASNNAGDSQIAIAVNGVAKGGAEGCVGVAIDGQLGLAAKAWDGIGKVANQAAARALTDLGYVSSVGVAELHPVLHPPVMGGGVQVGVFESRLAFA